MGKTFRKDVYIKDIIRETLRACKSFSKCSDSFFDFEIRNGWLGWENWLTVDIFRWLDHQYVDTKIIGEIK
jgi:hypothetical protein